MDDYIKRKDAMDNVCACCMETYFCNMNCIYDIPAADVRPVVHGKWILHDDGSGTCSNCKTRQMLIYDDDSWQHYCGNCGSKMDLKEETE